MTKDKADKVQEATAKLLDLWESGDISGAVARTILARKAGSRPCDSWSLSNQLLMMLAGTSDARGFRQWESVGRKVVKGSKALYILGPLVKKITEKDKTTGIETTKTIIYGFKAIPVFAVEDTEGEPVVVPDYAPVALPPLAEVAEAWGIKVTYGPATAGFYGYFDRIGKEIHLVTHDAEVFFHELAHAAHNKIRTLKGGQDAAQEIVAETAAAALTVLFGMEPARLRNSAKYVASYAGTDPAHVAKAVVKHLSEVQKVLELILTEAESLSGDSVSADAMAMAS